MDDFESFPFGTPLEASRPSTSEPRDTLLIGAFPAAISAYWKPPDAHGRESLGQVPVASAPAALWNEFGATMAWDERHPFNPAWGERDLRSSRHPEVFAALGYVLDPLGLTLRDVWATHCVNRFYPSLAAIDELQDWYDSRKHRLALPDWYLTPEPDDDELVATALNEHEGRLRDELHASGAARVISLGSAPYRVLREFFDARDLPDRLESSIDAYGREVELTFEGRPVKWLALADPQRFEAHRAAHDEWIERACNEHRGRREQCPLCGSWRVASIVYGEPGGDLFELEEVGLAALGGCVLSPANPRLRCMRCLHTYGSLGEKRSRGARP